MAPDLTSNWYTAVHEYLLHLQAHRAKTTVQFYECQLRQLANWADDEKIALKTFGKRHLDRYLAFRTKTVSCTTLHHDAVCAKAFFNWCVRNELIARNPLLDYEVKNAPRPARYMAAGEEIVALMQASQDFWNVKKNPNVKFHSPARRVFHRDRNRAILLLLLDTACRIGEALELSLEDYRPSAKQITIRHPKSREPRVLPLTTVTVSAIEEWLKMRKRIIARADTDDGYLFISEFGTMIETRRFLKTMKRYRAFAGVSESMTLHSLRRYSLNKLAKHNLLAAQQMAGHKSANTTLLYTKLDPDFVREMHQETGVVADLFISKRPIRKKLL